MKLFVALALSAAVQAVSEVEFAFMNYMSHFGKSYGTVEEYKFRLEQFTRSESAIAEHNSALGTTYKLGHNKMSDWTEAEYQRLLTYKPMPESAKVYGVAHSATPNSTVDWVAAGAVNAVKDQGQCGSCWAFSAAGTLESAHKIKSGTLLSFAEQQLVDCSAENFGCGGGWQYKAFEYYETSNAMAESSYPYTATDGTCAYNANNTTGKGTTGYTNVTPDNADAMKAALANGPLSVSIDASHQAFQYYTSGILADAKKCGTRLDHAVIVVGWGVEGTTEYWTVRNSWGASWGEQGYIRMAIIDGTGVCGVQMEPLYPNL